MFTAWRSYLVSIRWYFKNRAEAAHAAALREGGRASSARHDAVLALGIESGGNQTPLSLNLIGRQHRCIEGLFPCAGTLFDVCVVSAYDGIHHHCGLSCAFEVPKQILKHIHDGADLSQACNRSCITSDGEIGQHGGLIGLLTHGRITRKDYTMQAVNMALTFCENDEWYEQASR